MAPICWLAILIVMVVIEMMTMGLTTIWFAGGALAALLVSLLRIPVAIQGGVFVAVSVVLLIYTRPLATKYLNDRVQRTNSDELIGQEGVVEEMICNREALGRVQLNGIDWTARSVTGEDIPAGTPVIVQEIQGVKLMVCVKDSKEE